MTIKGNRDNRGGKLSVRRLLTAIGATLVLGIALAASSASAKTVYDYAYSGTFVDGSALGKSFTEGIGQPTYDRQDHVFYVPNSGEPGWVARVKPNGTGLNFTSSNSPIVTMLGFGTSINNPQVSVDQFGGATDGRFYVVGSNSKFAFNADGTTEVKFNEGNGENVCGVTPAPPDGSKILAPFNGAFSGGPLTYYNFEGQEVGFDYNGVAGYQPGVKKKFGGQICKPTFDSQGNLYGIKTFGGGPFSGELPHPIVKMTTNGLEFYEVSTFEDSRAVAIDFSNDDVFVLRGEQTFPPSAGVGSFELYDSAGRSLGGGWGGPEVGPSYPGVQSNSIGIVVDPETHDVWVANRHDYGSGVTHLEKFIRTNPHVIPDSTATDPIYDDPSGETVKLRGIVNADGVATTDCHFEYGTTQALGTNVPCEQGNVFTGSSDHVVTAKVSGTKGTRYYFKLSTKNANNQVALSNQKYYFPVGLPTFEFLSVDKVNTDGVRMNSEADPNGGNVSVHYEYGENGNYEEFSSPETSAQGFLTDPDTYSTGDKYLPGPKKFATEVAGLKQGTTYSYRVAVTNEAGTIHSPVQEFTTYVKDPGTDLCGNSQVRQQTESPLLPDCRAYELVSAQNSGGYDVESDIVPGQVPFTGYPDAKDRLLYSIHAGLIPGMAGSPTNYGRDPYVATRGTDGWTTSYVGLPADGMADEGAFGSPLLGSDAQLRTFAFGGEGICDPCFEDNSTNIPLRKSDGSLVKGMAGSSNPAADPSGEVRKPLSADGSHLIFGSEAKFEDAGNEGAVSIYDRNLSSNVTQVVSTMPNGSTMTGQVAELDVSANGNRVLIGKFVGEVGGNEYFDLYMHEGNSPNSVTVADTTNGVLYNGMTADGTKVFFTTKDPLPGDGDTSADLYRADVGTTDPAPITRVSTGSGGAGNTNSCTPVVNWNVVSGPGDCSIVALAGGAGVSAEDGTAYFVSPELLDGGGNGEAGQPNLYVVAPGGAPHYVGLLDSSAYKPAPLPPEHQLTSSNFITGLSNPGEIAVDQGTGDVYIAERGAGRVSRYTSAGAAKPFTSVQAYIEGNRITGQNLGGGGEGQVSVDSANSSPFKGAVYVTTNGGSVRVYANSGEKLGELTGFNEACGVSVDPANGNVYVGDYSSNVWRFKPISAVAPVTNASYSPKEGIEAPDGLCNIDAQAPSFVYTWNYSGGGMKQYPKSAFAVVPGSPSGTPIGSGRHAQSDPQNSDFYVNEISQVTRYSSSGAVLEKFGSGIMSGSRGVAINATTKHVYVTSGNSIQEYGLFTPPYDPIDSVAVEHGVHQNGVHSYEDFQVTPDGRYALFSSPAPLTGYQNQGHYELYRYDSAGDSLECPSCAPSGAVGGSDVGLSPYGLNLIDDGRVFFTTSESFTLRDTNEKRDAYEWSNGKPELISTGIGQDDSTLLTAGSDGTDAFFFTRDTLSPEDLNGKAVKVYDARVNGGFFREQRTPDCAASDECHGPGTEAPGPPGIATQTGSGKPNTIQPKPCPKGKVKHKGKCVKKHKKKNKKSKSKSTGGRG